MARKRKTKNARERQSLTWLKSTKKDLGKMLRELEEIPPDKIKYKALIDSIVLLQRNLFDLIFLKWQSNKSSERKNSANDPN